MVRAWGIFLFFPVEIIVEWSVWVYADNTLIEHSPLEAHPFSKLPRWPLPLTPQDNWWRESEFSFLNCSRVIYKCSCETVFNKKKLLQEHFQQNTSKLFVGVFKCPQCQLVYMQKQQLMQHVKVGNSHHFMIWGPSFWVHREFALTI